MASKAQSLSISTHFKSQQELLSHHLLEDSFWGHPTDKKVETGSLSFVNPDVQKLLPERVELKIWKEKEKKRDQTTTRILLQICSSHWVMSRTPSGE